jgi:hypothetical protein
MALAWYVAGRRRTVQNAALYFDVNPHFRHFCELRAGFIAF